MDVNTDGAGRARAPGLDALLGAKFPVLKDGYVMAVDYMGNDDAIVEAARASYGKGTKKVSTPKRLIRRLMQDQHSSPMEMCEIKMQVRVPMDAWRQWIR